MQRTFNPSYLIFLVFLWAGCTNAPNTAAAGMSAERLDRLRIVVREDVDAGKYAGAVVLIRRKGELERELRALTTERARLENVEALKKALRKQRLEE